MGAWGIEALESDNGLDVIDILSSGYVSGHTELKLGEMAAVLKEKGFFGETFEGIDYLYDNSAMALSEIYLKWLDTKVLDYDNEDEAVWRNVTAFSADQGALEFLLRYLHDIKNEVPDEDDEREIVELWRESDHWEEWSAHLSVLIQRLEQEQRAVRILPSKLFPDCNIPVSGDAGFFDRTPDGFDHEVYLYLGEETVADEKAIEKAAKFFDKAVYWDAFCRETILSFQGESEEYRTVKAYFEFYQEEVPEVFGAADVSALSLSDMVERLTFKSMASHESGDEQSFVVDFTLGYDQILCVKFNSESNYENIAWES